MRKTRISQKQLVLKHMIDFGKISTIDAFLNYEIFRLSSIIYILKNEGYKIKGTLVTEPTRYGNTRNIIEYSLIK